MPSRLSQTVFAVLCALAWMTPAVAQRPGTEIVVTSQSDGPLLPLPGDPTPIPCILRDAIEAANTNKIVGGCPAGQQARMVSANPVVMDYVDRILFEFDSGDPRIGVRNQLPTITEAVIIDGALPTGERVILDGSGILVYIGGPGVHGLVVSDIHTTLKDLVIQNFPGHGIFLTDLDETGAPLPAPFDPPDFEEDPPTEDPGGDPCGPNGYPNPDDPCSPPSGGGGGPDIPPVEPGGGGGHTILGCRIGTDADGTVAMPNTRAGVAVAGSGNRIGGEEPDEGNLISGNLEEGVVVSGVNNEVIGNLIGTDADGQAPIPNGGDGLRIDGGQFGGSTVDLMGNTVFFNGGDGVRVDSGKVFAWQNTIDDNDELGIDLGPDGPTPSTTGVLQVPELTLWTLGGFGPETICGRLQSTPLSDVVVEFFHVPNCDPSEFGEGREPIGTQTVKAGDTDFQFQLPGAYSGWITATVTSSGGTSEFSQCLDGPSLLTRCPPSVSNP